MLDVLSVPGGPFDGHKSGARHGAQAGGQGCARAAVCERDVRVTSWDVGSGTKQKFERCLSTPHHAHRPKLSLRPDMSKHAHFLGLELAIDQLRATIVDDQLDLLAVEAVDFDTELPDYQSVFP